MKQDIYILTTQHKTILIIMTISTILYINNADNSSILNEIIHLSYTLGNIAMPIKQLGLIAKQQLALIKVYTKQIKDRIIVDQKDNFKWLYKHPSTNRMNDTKRLVVSDKYKYKRYFSRKMKDFRNNLNICYIEISTKFHNLFRKLKSIYNLVVRDYLYSIIRIQYPRYREYKRIVKCTKIYNRFKLNKELIQYAK